MSNRKKLQPGLKLALGFMLLIAIGALLLYLPLSHQDGVDVSFIDALFISTSAICVRSGDSDTQSLQSSSSVSQVVISTHSAEAF